jgi:hypothetical protein
MSSLGSTLHHSNVFVALMPAHPHLLRSYKLGRIKANVRLVQRTEFSLLLIYRLLKLNYWIQVSKTKMFSSGILTNILEKVVFQQLRLKNVVF